MATSLIDTNDEIKYSKLLSSLFCFISIIISSILCLLNNLTLDIYSACMLLKVVIPASFCYWFLGKIMGQILDKNQNGKNSVNEVKLTNDNEAYNIPSMFASDSTPTEDSELGEL